jgi:hypothetical protein
MNHTPSAAELRSRAEQVLADQAYSSLTPANTDKLSAYILPAMQHSKNIQSGLYSWEPPVGGGRWRQIKNWILLKCKSVVVNILERSFVRQQKYNELNYQALEILQQRIQHLESQLPQTKHEQK